MFEERGYNYNYFPYYFITIHLPFRFEPIRLITFLFFKDTNDLSIVLLLKPIFFASSAEV